MIAPSPQSLKATVVMPNLKPILVTLAAFAAFRLGNHVPLPGVDMAQFGQSLGRNFDMSRVSLLALGLMPWLSALTMIELAAISLPSAVSTRLGFGGRNTPFSMPVIVLALLLAALQGYGIAVALTHVPKLVTQADAWFVATTAISLAAGTALIIALGRTIEKHGIGHGFWVMLAGSMVAGVPGSAAQLYAMVAQGVASPSAAAAALAADVAIMAAVVALLDARRRSGFDNAEPVVWPVILAPLLASWIIALAVLLLPGGASTQHGAINFFLISHPIGLATQAAIACALVARYALRENNLGFLLPTAALAVGVILLGKFMLSGMQILPLIGGPSAVVVAAVCYVVAMRWQSWREAEQHQPEKSP